MAVGQFHPLPDLECRVLGPDPYLWQRVHELPAVPDSAALARQLTATALEQEQSLDPDRRDDVLLAVSEAVTNAIRHGYRGTPGRVTLSLRRTIDRLCVIVGDQGSGLSAPSLDPGLGLGMELIRQVVDDVAFVAGPDGGTVAEMVFAV